jgi:hypothetical protein
VTLDELQLCCESMCRDPYRDGYLEKDIFAITLKLIAVARAAEAYYLSRACFSDGESKDDLRKALAALEES